MRYKKIFMTILLMLLPFVFIKSVKAATWTVPTTFTEIDTIEQLSNSSGSGSAYYQNSQSKLWFYDLNGDIFLFKLKTNFQGTLLLDAKAAYIAETGITPPYFVVKGQLEQDSYYLTWAYSYGVGALVDFQFGIANSQQQFTSYYTKQYTVMSSHGFGFLDNVSPLLDGAGSLVQSKNLFKLIDTTIVSQGLDITVVDNVVEINGTSNGLVSEAFIILQNQIPSGTYTIRAFYISGTKTLNRPNIRLVGDYNAISNLFDNIQNAKSTFSATETIKKVSFYMGAEVGTFTNFKFRVQIEAGSNETPWMHPDSIYYSTASIQHDQAPESVSTIMSNVYAFDDVDGNITDRFVTVNTARKYAAVLANKWRLNVNEVLAAYDDNTLSIPITNTITLNKAYVDAQFDTYKVGTYWYNLENDSIIPKGLTAPYKFLSYVGDTTGNYSFLEINVFINDVTAPVFSVENATTHSIGYKETFDLSTWLQSIIVWDNYDQSVALSILTDNYTANKTQMGSYTVIVKAMDDTGNTSEKTFLIKVIDNVKPVITGPEQIFKPLSGTMTITDIKGRFTAFDEISGNVTSRITVDVDNYTGFGHIPGTYYVTFKVTDLNTNYQYYTFPIIVRDDIPPVIYVADGYFIQLSTAYSLTLEGIKNILVATGRLTIVATTTYTVLIDEYFGHESIPGVYTVSIRFDSTSGVSEVHSVSLKVVQTSFVDGTISGPSTMNFVFIALGVGAVLCIVFIYKRKS